LNLKELTTKGMEGKKESSIEKNKGIYHILFLEEIRDENSPAKKEGKKGIINNILTYFKK
jgi:hypothetical protein